MSAGSVWSIDARVHASGTEESSIINSEKNYINNGVDLIPPTHAGTSSLEDVTPTLVEQPDAYAVGLSDPTLSASRRRKLDAINKLHSLGAHLDVDLPQIVVVGSQSVGKSSLIESISGITLPRASGTCTRCPIECRLNHSDTAWECSISLRFMTDELDDPIDPVRNVPFGGSIQDPRKVEDRIRRAQRAVLNPNINFKRFLEDDYRPSGNILEFTRNCVSVDIRGPDVTDLSFCDLPGLIASVSDRGRDEDIQKVEELVSSYISKQSCIILLTVACEADFETQGAYRLVRQYDSKGSRTIGVLTKPDRIPEGEESRWLGLIKNETSALVNGWYSVKQPSTKEIKEGLVHQDARRMEENFFKKQPWLTLEARHRGHLGSQAVTQKLNEFLMAVISKRIPEIMQELQLVVRQTKDKLEELPTRVSRDPILEMMHLVGDFSNDLYMHAEGFNQHISSDPMGNQFEPIRNAHDIFERMINNTAPVFRPFEEPQLEAAPEEARSRATTPGIHYVSSPAPTWCLSHPGTPRIALEGLDPLEGNDPCSSQTPVYLGDVIVQVQRARTRELPGYFPFHVLQDFITRFTSQWEQPTRSLVDSIYTVVNKHRQHLIEKYFSGYTEGGLHPMVLHIVQEYTAERRERSLERVKWLLELEAHAFTLNRDYLNACRNKFLGSYKEERRRHIGGYSHTSEPWDPDQFAIEIMATVQAYFKVAKKRIVDTILLAVDHELVRVQKRDVQDALFDGLQITGPEAPANCQRFLAEPSEVVARREELRNRLVRLEAALKQLMHI